MITVADVIGTWRRPAPVARSALAAAADMLAKLRPDDELVEEADELLNTVGADPYAMLALYEEMVARIRGFLPGCVRWGWGEEDDGPAVGVWIRWDSDEVMEMVREGKTRQEIEAEVLAQPI